MIARCAGKKLIRAKPEIIHLVEVLVVFQAL